MEVVDYQSLRGKQGLTDLTTGFDVAPALFLTVDDFDEAGGDGGDAGGEVGIDEVVALHCVAAGDEVDLLLLQFVNAGGCHGVFSQEGDAGTEGYELELSGVGRERD